MSKRTKKPKNPDNLYQRGDTWWIRYNAGGKKIRRSLGTTNLREAKRLRDKIMVKRSAAAKFGIEEPQKAAPVRTFAQIAELWLEARAAEGRLAPKTLLNDRRSMRTVHVPVFGPIPMSSITVEDIERFIGDLRKRYARATVAFHFATLGKMIRYAARRDWFDGRNPLERLDRVPSYGPGRDVTLTEEEATRLLAGLSGPLHYKSALALYTGLRWGEVHGLAWADIKLDAEPATLTVRRSFRGPPKNTASAATVPISTAAAALLRRWRTEQGDDCPWVFPTINNTIAARGPWREGIYIHKAAARAGIDKHITPHVFRHSFGTWVYERTHDPKMVQRLMRHASFHTSMRYVHDHRDLGPVVDLLPNLTPRAELRVI